MPIADKSGMLEYCRYNDPQVRALVWSLISPGLVNESGAYSACVSQHWCCQIYQKIQPFLQQLDNDSAPLILWLEKQKSWRIGIRFEAYWSFILEQLCQQSEIVSYAAHIQIQNNSLQNKSLQNNSLQNKSSHKAYNTTLGELDFVYLDKQQQLNHLEIAVKFYLLKADEFGFERLIGPNGSDWFERKLEHLFKKQLPLSDSQDAQVKLQELFYPADKKNISSSNNPDRMQCHHQGLMKGMIFFPVTGEGGLNDNEISCINANYPSGLWATIDNWYLSDPGEIGRWIMFEKLDWLIPQIYSSEEDLFNAREMAYKLKIHFHGTRRSVLIARLDYDEKQKLWVEEQRIMVVDRYWPTFERPAAQ